MSGKGSREKGRNSSKKRQHWLPEAGEWLGAFSGLNMKRLPYCMCTATFVILKPKWRHNDKHVSAGFVELCGMLLRIHVL